MSTVGGLCNLLSYSNPLPQWVNDFCSDLEKNNISCDNYVSTSNRFSKLGDYGKHIFFPLFTGLLGGMTSQFLFPFTVSAPVTIILSSVSSAAAEYSIQEKNSKNIDWGRVFSAGFTSLIGFGGALLYKNSKREIPIWARASLNAFHTTFTEFMGVLGEHRTEGKKVSLTTIGEKLMNRDILGLLACSMIQGEGFHRGARLFVKTGYDEGARNLRNERKKFKPLKDEDSDLRQKIDPRITLEREIGAAVDAAFQRIQAPQTNGVVKNHRSISSGSNGHSRSNSIPTDVPEDAGRTARVSLPPRPLKEDEISSLIPRALQDEKALNLLLVHLRDRSSSLTDDHLTKIAGNLFAGLSIFNPSQARRLHTAVAALPDNRGHAFLAQERLGNQFAYNTFHPSLGGLNPQSRTNMHALYQDPEQNGQVWETLATIRAAATTPGTESALRITEQRGRRKKMESGENQTERRSAEANASKPSTIRSPFITKEQQESREAILKKIAEGQTIETTSTSPQMPEKSLSEQTIHEFFADLAS